MHRAVRTLVPLALVLATCTAAHAAPPKRAQPRPATERPNADLLPSAARLRLSATAKAAAASPTLEEVGDVDSFGRNLKWLGVANGFMSLASSCSPAPGEFCQVLNPSPASTAYSFADTARIVLPAKATNSLLCYWLSPVVNVTYHNATTAPAVARLSYVPTLTVENPVLADPALIDPTTGAPFAGRLVTSMTSSESYQVPLPAGVQITERTRDSAVCIAGFLTKRTLIDVYGLTESQAKAFFNRPTTVRLNVQGVAQHVSNASLVFGLRIIGD